MLKELSHYGRKVMYQVISTFFKDDLHKMGIKYIEVPNLDYDIVFYRWDGQDRYAVIKQGDGIENVYITDSIPLDTNWELLIRDCNEQLNGKKPMDMRTKAKMILNAACENAAEFCQGENVDFFEPEEPTALDIKFALARLGYNVKEIKKMDHHDIDQDFLERLERA